MAEARELLDDGRRSQQLGALDRAFECFRRASEAAAEPATAAEAWRRMSSVHRARCDWPAALEAAHRARSLARRAGDDDALAEALNAEAAVHMSRGEMLIAGPLLEEAVELARSDRTMGITLQNLGFVAARTGDLDGAERYFQVSGAHFRRAGYRWGEACVLTNRAGAALDRRDYQLAATTARQAIDVAREVEDLGLLARATKNRAEALAELGELRLAEDLVSESLGYFGAADDHVGQVETFKLLGDISARRGDETTARRCYEKGLEVAHRIEMRLESAQLSDLLGGLAGSARPPSNKVGDDANSPSAGAGPVS
ncbi:MAG TPA: hypothetical protein VMM18_05890 [Gemmatimonadaceae bacterium]|nr:hypothetical protein [Gemmatimonadaceae bacterium]